MVIAGMFLVPLLSKVSKEHSCPFASDSVMEEPGGSCEIGFGCHMSLMFLSEAPQGGQVMGTLFRLAIGTARTPSSVWEHLAQVTVQGGGEGSGMTALHSSLWQRSCG